MNHQQTGFRISFAIHAGVLLLIIVLNSSMVSFSKPVVIDFSVEDTSAKEAPQAVPTSRIQETNLRRSEPVPEPAVAQQKASASETALEGQSPKSASTPTSLIAKAPENTASAHQQASSAETKKQSYLKEHFAYIRKMVQQKLSYPQPARQMGWEGRVIISFVVCIDGHAKDITITEGSGIAMLDNNAVVAVQKASPFPKPPMEAQLIIPVSYVLR